MVLGVLAENTGHITADKVLASVQQQYPYINKTTVYRTLELLCEVGLVAITHLDGTAAEYELLDGRHHHLVCKRCGHNIELPDTALDPLRETIEHDYGFQPCFDHFALFGVCHACQDGQTS
jgi:Fur family ferric uptake transcriptional regulator